MTSTNQISKTSSSPFSFNAQFIGIMTSVIIHAAILLLLLLLPVTKKIPHLQIIQISLEQMETSVIDNPKGAEQITTTKVNPEQIKISQPVAMQKEVVPKHIVSGEQEAITQVLPAEGPAVVENRNLEIVGSTNAEDQNGTKSKMSITPNTGNGGIVKTEFGELDAPRFIHREMPAYPMLARRLGKEGKVILKLLIDRDGTLQNIEVVESVGFGFTEAAVTAVKNSTYAPASLNGEKVATKALLPVRFYMQ